MLTFHYLYVGLPGLDGVQYVQGENWLGIVLARLDGHAARQGRLARAEARRRLTECSFPISRSFCWPSVQAYLPLEEQQKWEYERILLGEAYAKVRAMNKTVFEEGLEKGIERGMERGIEKGMGKGLQSSLLRLGGRGFGRPSDDIENQIRSIQDLARLEMLTDRILDVDSWEELLSG